MFNYLSSETRVNTVLVFLVMIFNMCVLRIYVDTASMSLSRVGSMHGCRERSKEIALCHLSTTQPGLQPLTDPVSIISG